MQASGSACLEYYGAFATAYFYSFAGCTNIGLFAMCGLLSQSESGAGGPSWVIFCGIISIEGAPSLRSWQGRLKVVQPPTLSGEPARRNAFRLGVG